MTVTVKHSKTNAISDWTQAQLDEQIALGNFAEGTVLADIVLPSDWNNDHTLTGVGTMAEQDANNVAITGGTATLSSVTTPSVTASTDNLTLSAISTGKINLNTATANQVQITDATAANGQYTLLSRDNTNNEQRISANASSGGVNFGISSAVAGAIKFYTNGFTELQAQVSRTTSAVNYVQVTGGATGTYPAILGTGSDGTVGLQLAGKGGGTIDFRNNGIGTATQFSVAFTASSVNYLNATGSGVSGNAPRLFALGTDTNISMAFQPKGTGAIDLAAGSSGVNISNGGTVTAITRTNSGSGYTTIPSIAITAPTTAGGVQATASVAQMQIAGATIAGGGTGYTVGNTLTIVGGTPVSGAATLTVTTVSAGVITGVSIAAFNNYTALPTNPVSVTGGSGSGATFNLTWAVISFTITNAGSGYIEQPTITFSGGGGSGAAAYATVGGTPQIKGLGSLLNFYVANQNIALQLEDLGGTGTAYWKFRPGNGSVNPIMISSAAGGQIATSGTSPLIFQTSSSTAQFYIAHTASAVNYVQVTGSVTGAAASSLGGLSFTGSDASPNFAIGTKGTGYIAFYGGAATNVQAFRINTTNAANTGNLLQVQGAAAGSAPSISAISGTSGTDANIDLALTPKGTGVVQFGTHTANADVAISGFITIRDAGGTLRKLAVIT